MRKAGKSITRRSAAPPTLRRYALCPKPNGVARRTAIGAEREDLDNDLEDGPDNEGEPDQDLEPSLSDHRGVVDGEPEQGYAPPSSRPEGAQKAQSVSTRRYPRVQDGRRGAAMKALDAARRNHERPHGSSG